MSGAAPLSHPPRSRATRTRSRCARPRSHSAAPPAHRRCDRLTSGPGSSRTSGSPTRERLAALEELLAQLQSALDLIEKLRSRQLPAGGR